MVNPPQTTNTEASLVDSIIQDINTTGVQIVEKLAEADVPALALPVIKQVFEFVLGFIDLYISKAEQMGATFAVIDGQIYSEQNGMTKALASVMSAEKGGDPNAIKQAIQNYANAQSALVHFDGSKSPN